MTRQYVAGELSVLLGRLQCALPSASWSQIAGSLRHEAEDGSPSELSAVAMEGLEIADCGCWESLAKGDMEAFRRLSGIAAELWEFAVCAGLVNDH